MSILEIIATVLIASYAMAGGAFLNAAITSPENCKKILDIALKPGPMSGYHKLCLMAG
ncbi:hypothetical protein [Pseudogemmobacter humi]|uniref:hypothetical protein n=1 Tax=Pseudogemmobacter humi TaxID=2483812 RepID=UPI00135914BA|nr:hypothetical protein [Pseudogemmobacter humi]